MIDRKGILSYLLITFVITYAVEGALIASGFRVTALPPIIGQYVIMGVMWVPALATVITIRFITREGFSITNLRFGSWKPYLLSLVVIPACFIVTYGLTWLFGLGRPDWELTYFYNLVSSAGGGYAEFPPAGQIFAALFMASLFAGPVMNGVVAMGEEFGWRGYLLPKPLPLGKPRAYLLLGIIWGLWHAPLILVGFDYPGYTILGLVAMMGMTTALGLYMNEFTLRYRSSILAGWIHGVFNAQAYGIWRILFPIVNPLLGGITGIIGIPVLSVAGLWAVRRGQRVEATKPVTRPA